MGGHLGSGNQFEMGSVTKNFDERSEGRSQSFEMKQEFERFLYILGKSKHKNHTLPTDG